MSAAAGGYYSDNNKFKDYNFILKLDLELNEKTKDVNARIKSLGRTEDISTIMDSALLELENARILAGSRGDNEAKNTYTIAHMGLSSVINAFNKNNNIKIGKGEPRREGGGGADLKEEGLKGKEFTGKFEEGKFEDGKFNEGKFAAGKQLLAAGLNRGEEEGVAAAKPQKELELKLRAAGPGKGDSEIKELEDRDSLEGRRHVRFSEGVSRIEIPPRNEIEELNEEDIVVEKDEVVDPKTDKEIFEEALATIILSPVRFIQALPDEDILEELQKPSHPRFNLKELADGAFENIKALKNELEASSKDQEIPSKVNRNFNEIKRKVEMIRDYYAGKQITLKSQPRELRTMKKEQVEAGNDMLWAMRLYDKLRKESSAAQAEGAAAASADAAAGVAAAVAPAAGAPVATVAAAAVPSPHPELASVESIIRWVKVESLKSQPPPVDPKKDIKCLNKYKGCIEHNLPVTKDEIYLVIQVANKLRLYFEKNKRDEDLQKCKSDLQTFKNHLNRVPFADSTVIAEYGGLIRDNQQKMNAASHADKNSKDFSYKIDLLKGRKQEIEEFNARFKFSEETGAKNLVDFASSMKKRLSEAKGKLTEKQEENSKFIREALPLFQKYQDRIKKKLPMTKGEVDDVIQKAKELQTRFVPKEEIPAMRNFVRIFELLDNRLKQAPQAMGAAAGGGAGGPGGPTDSSYG